MGRRTRSRSAVMLVGTAGLLSLSLALMPPVAADVSDDVDPPCPQIPRDGPVELPPMEKCKPAEEPAPAPAPEPTEPALAPEPAPEPNEPTPEPDEPAPELVEGPPSKSGPPAPSGASEDGAMGAPARDASTADASTASVVEGPVAGVPFSFLGGRGSTEELVEILMPLVERGIPLEEALLRVVGPFPVAGLSWWTNDWHAPRCCPQPHLHQGIDMFAEEGTPLVAIADGRVTQRRAGSVSGLSVEITDEHGVEYFYAHLSDFADGLQAGQEVSRGDVIGYVGDTGNARGTMPHLHLEVQPEGVSVPPIPYVEEWLEQAERKAVRWVERVTGEAAVVASPTSSLGASPATTGQRLEHPAVPSDGAAPASVEALDASASADGSSEQPSSAIGAAALEPAAGAPEPDLAPRATARPWPAPESARLELMSLGLLLTAALVVIIGGLVRRPPARSRKRRRVEPARVPVEPVAAEPAPSSVDPETVGSDRSERDGELVGAGSTMLLLLVGLLLLAVARRAGR